MLDSSIEKVKAKHTAQKSHNNSHSNSNPPSSDDDPSITWIDNFQRISSLLKELGPSPKSKHQSRKKGLLNNI